MQRGPTKHEIYITTFMCVGTASQISEMFAHFCVFSNLPSIKHDLHEVIDINLNTWDWTLHSFLV